MAQLTLKVEGMSCQHCKMSVEKALQKLPGVEKADVNLATGEVLVIYREGAVTREDMKKAIEAAGYDVKE
ncbi:MAG: copper chaperone [Eubacteriales bacterium]|nr:copper chaperone [Eubacteriales bacterium]